MEKHEVQARVAAGAAWLDRERPGWVGEINVLTLNIANPFTCVLGQLYGGGEEDRIGYYHAVNNVLEGRAQQAVELGFQTDAYFPGDRRLDLERLTEEWLQVVTAKREELGLAA